MIKVIHKLAPKISAYNFFLSSCKDNIFIAFREKGSAWVVGRAKGKVNHRSSCLSYVP